MLESFQSEGGYPEIPRKLYFNLNSSGEFSESERIKLIKNLAIPIWEVLTYWKNPELPCPKPILLEFIVSGITDLEKEKAALERISFQLLKIVGFYEESLSENFLLKLNLAIYINEGLFLQTQNLFTKAPYINLRVEKLAQIGSNITCRISLVNQAPSVRLNFSEGVLPVGQKEELKKEITKSFVPLLESIGGFPVVNVPEKGNVLLFFYVEEKVDQTTVLKELFSRMVEVIDFYQKRINKRAKSQKNPLLNLTVYAQGQEEFPLLVAQNSNIKTQEIYLKIETADDGKNPGRFYVVHLLNLVEVNSHPEDKEELQSPFWVRLLLMFLRRVF